MNNDGKDRENLSSSSGHGYLRGTTKSSLDMVDDESRILLKEITKAFSRDIEGYEAREALIGRELEYAQMTEHIAKCTKQAMGAFILLTGGSGLGKTSTARAIAHNMTQLDGCVLPKPIYVSCAICSTLQSILSNIVEKDIQLNMDFPNKKKSPIGSRNKSVADKIQMMRIFMDSWDSRQRLIILDEIDFFARRNKSHKIFGDICEAFIRNKFIVIGISNNANWIPTQISRIENAIRINFSPYNADTLASIVQDRIYKCLNISADRKNCKIPVGLSLLIRRICNVNGDIRYIFDALTRTLSEGNMIQGEKPNICMEDRNNLAINDDFNAEKKPNIEREWKVVSADEKIYETTPISTDASSNRSHQFSPQEIRTPMNFIHLEVNSNPSPNPCYLHRECIENCPPGETSHDRHCMSSMTLCDSRYGEEIAKPRSCIDIKHKLGKRTFGTDITNLMPEKSSENIISNLNNTLNEHLGLERINATTHNHSSLINSNSIRLKIETLTLIQKIYLLAICRAIEQKLALYEDETEDFEYKHKACDDLDESALKVSNDQIQREYELIMSTLGLDHSGSLSSSGFYYSLEAFQSLGLIKIIHNKSKRPRSRLQRSLYFSTRTNTNLSGYESIAIIPRFPKPLVKKVIEELVPVLSEMMNYDHLRK